MTAAVNDARALLTLFARSPWLDLHVRTATATIFIAKPGGAPNPLRAVAATRQSATELGVSQILVSAPHLGSVVSTLPLGAQVSEGDVVGCLELLGEMIEIASPASGVIEELFVGAGALAEFETPLLAINPVRG